MPWTLRMTLLITGLTAVCMIYNIARLYWYSRQTGLHSPQTFWALCIGTVVLIFSYPLSGWLIYVSAGSFSREWFPVWMIVLFWYGFIFNAILLTWILAIDLINLIVTRLFKIKRPQFQTIFGLGAVFITVSVFLFTAVKATCDTYRVNADQISFEKASVYSDGQEPMRIVHISEIHADRYTSPARMDRYMQKVREAEPHIVLITGDLISSGLDYLEVAADAVSSVHPPLGVHFVMGDHDFWSGQDQIAEALESRGVNVIRDSNEWLELGGQSIKITGVTEVYSRSIDRSLLRDLLEENRGEQVSILFSHQAPDDMIDLARESETDILLAGHTHGGQIRIPVFFKKLTAASMETDYVLGHWLLDEMLLNINSGLGFTLAPIRYNAPAEVSVIEVNL